MADNINKDNKLVTAGSLSTVAQHVLTKAKDAAADVADDLAALSKTVNDNKVEFNSHNHDSRYYTETEINSKITTINNAIAGKADKSHGNHVPATETANNAKFLRNDNTWQTVTPGNIGAYTTAQVDGFVNEINNTLSNHGTHVTYATATPKANSGNGSVGTSSKVAREDHVHPVQTTVSGNAGSANKVNNKLSIQLNSGTATEFDGSAAKSINITPSSINAYNKGEVDDALKALESEIDTKLAGKAESSHGVHVPAPETANKAKFLRNDNTWQTVTPANIGASASGHTHDDRYYTESEINTKLAGKSDTNHTHSYAGSASVGGPANSAVILQNAKTLKIGDSGKTFNGSADVTWTLKEIGIEGVDKILFERFDRGTITGNGVVTLADLVDKSLIDIKYVDDFGTFNVGDYYLGRLTTNVYFSADTAWETTAKSDDGSTLYLNGVQVASITSASTTVNVTLNFKAGWNKIVWVFNENTGSDLCSFGSSIKSVSNFVRMYALPIGGGSDDVVGYAGVADKLRTARTITLGGDLSGNAQFDGSSNITISAQVLDDSHIHDGRYYTESEIDSKVSTLNSDISKAQTNATNTATSNAKTYTNTSISSLVNGASLNTLKKLEDAINDNQDEFETHVSTMNTKINDIESNLGSHTHNYAGSSSAGGAATSANRVNNKLSIQLNSGTATEFDGSSAKTVNVTPSGIGAYTKGEVDSLLSGKSDTSHTHDGRYYTETEIDDKIADINDAIDLKADGGHTHKYAGSSSVGGAANSANKVNSSLTLKLNSGTTEGTDLFTFNGSAAKTINVTPSGIGAYTKGEVDGLVNEINTTLAGKANSSHGNHVPKTQTANNAVFLRNDNTWQTVTPANIGAAASSHGNHVPTTQTANNATFLRNDNTWQKVTPANIGAAPATHGHDDLYYTESEIDTKVGTIKAAIETAKTNAISSSKSYTDTAITNLVNGAPDTLNTLKELSDAIGAHQDVYDAYVEEVQGKLNEKSDVGHTHNYAASSTAGGAATSANKVNKSLKVQLNGGTTEGTNQFTFDGSSAKTINITPSSIGAAASSHGTHLTLGTGSGNAYRGDYGNTAYQHAISAHAPADAQKNQNAFSNIIVGTTTVSADNETDSLTLVAGSNVTITPDATNDKITIAAKDTTYSTATVSTAGLMSASDKSKLDGIATGANAYSHPTYTSKTSGLYKITVDGTGHVSAATAVTKSDITGLGIPAQDTTYGTGNGSTAGLTRLYTGTGTATNGTMTQNAITTALNGKASSSHTHDDKYYTEAEIDGKLEEIGTRIDGKANSSHGSHVPTPETANSRKFLRNDNTWQSLPTATTGATGIVQLSSSTSSTSETLAATPKAVKAAYDLANNKPSLGTSSTTACPGDRGETAYQHSQAKHAPSNAQKNSDITKKEIEDKLTGTISTHSHSSIIGEDLKGKTVSLNDYKILSGGHRAKYYYCLTDDDGSGITGRPDNNNKKAFTLIVEGIRYAGDTDYICKQTYIQGNTKKTHVRYCTNGTWSNWELVYTSVQKPSASDVGTYSKTEIDTKLGGKSNTGHNHDDRYYTETEINDKLSGKANSSHTHSATNITSGTLDAARLPAATESVKGATIVYTGTGSKTDGTMTQKAITDALNTKSNTHNHPYLELAGGTVTGSTTFSAGLISGGTVKPNGQGAANLGGETNPWGTAYAKDFSLRPNGNKIGYGNIKVETVGTTSVTGEARLILGNTTATGAADNATGKIFLYGTKKGYTEIKPGNNGTSNITLTLPSSTGTLALTTAATTSDNGLMTKEMVNKLDGIQAGANAYSHPTFTSKSSGLYKITVDGNGHVSAATAVAKSDITGLGIPGSDTHHQAKNIVGASSTATANAASTNGNTYLNVVENNTVRSAIKITGSGDTSVTSNASGVITISSTAVISNNEVDSSLKSIFGESYIPAQ